MPMTLSAYAAHSPPVAGRFYSINAGAQGAAVVGGKDLLYLARWDNIPHPIVADQVISKVNTLQAGSSYKIAFWRENPVTMLPTGLPFVVPVGTVDSSSTGAKTSSLPATTQFPWPVFWHGVVFDGTNMPSMICLSPAATPFVAARGSVAATNSVAASTLTTGLSASVAFSTNLADLDLSSAVFSDASTVPALSLRAA